MKGYCILIACRDADGRMRIRSPASAKWEGYINWYIHACIAIGDWASPSEHAAPGITMRHDPASAIGALGIRHPRTADVLLRLHEGRAYRPVQLSVSHAFYTYQYSCTPLKCGGRERVVPTAECVHSSTVCTPHAPQTPTRTVHTKHHSASVTGHCVSQ